jgi:hypothetical protein
MMSSVVLLSSQPVPCAPPERAKFSQKSVEMRVAPQTNAENEISSLIAFLGLYVAAARL